MGYETAEAALVFEVRLLCVAFGVPQPATSAVSAAARANAAALDNERFNTCGPPYLWVERSLSKKWRDGVRIPRACTRLSSKGVRMSLGRSPGSQDVTARLPTQAAVASRLGFAQPALLFTVAGPRRIFTGFPILFAALPREAPSDVDRFPS